MGYRTRIIAPLGQVVAAAFDEAAELSSDRREVSRLATQAIARILQRALTHAGAVPRPGPAFQGAPPQAVVG